MFKRFLPTGTSLFLSRRLHGILVRRSVSPKAVSSSSIPAPLPLYHRHLWGSRTPRVYAVQNEAHQVGHVSWFQQSRTKHRGGYGDCVFVMNMRTSHAVLWRVIMPGLVAETDFLDYASKANPPRYAHPKALSHLNIRPAVASTPVVRFTKFPVWSPST